MISIRDHEAVRFAGAQQVTRAATGLRPSRLPVWAVNQIHDPAFRFSTNIASGVRVTFASDTDAIEAEVMLTGIELPEMSAPTPRFDLVVDGTTFGARQSNEGNRWVAKVVAGAAQPYELEFRNGDVSRIRFDGLGHGMKRIELWMPQNRWVEVRGLRVADGAKVEAARARRGGGGCTMEARSASAAKPTGRRRRGRRSRRGWRDWT